MAETIYAVLICAIAADAAAADLLTPEEGRFVFDGVRPRIGDGVTPGGLKVLMQGEGGAACEYDSDSVTSGASDLTFAWASVQPVASRIVAIGAGAGDYTLNVILPTTFGGDTLTAGAQCTVVVNFATTVEGYLVDFFSGATSNPRLMRAASQPGANCSAQVTFFFNGAAWVAGPLIQTN